MDELTNGGAARFDIALEDGEHGRRIYSIVVVVPRVVVGDSSKGGSP